jgi:hypothetical protein
MDAYYRYTIGPREKYTRKFMKDSNKIRDTIINMTNERKRSLIALLLTFVVLIGGGYLIKYSVLSKCEKNPLGPWCPGKPTNLNSTQINPDGSTEANIDTEAPFIKSISPDRGPKGTSIVIEGQNLAGFEGDLDVIFEDATGNKFSLNDNESYVSTGGSIIKVDVKEPCQKGETIYGRYSGIASMCNFKEMKPGTYKVYVEPWGKRSNVASFIITK